MHLATGRACTAEPCWKSYSHAFVYMHLPFMSCQRVRMLRQASVPMALQVAWWGFAVQCRSGLVAMEGFAVWMGGLAYMLRLLKPATCNMPHKRATSLSMVLQPGPGGTTSNLAWRRRMRAPYGVHVRHGAPCSSHHAHDNMLPFMLTWYCQLVHVQQLCFIPDAAQWPVSATHPRCGKPADQDVHPS